MKNINLKLISLLTVLLTFNLRGQEAKITVHVTDDNGLAISNAQASVGFVITMKPGEGWGSAGENNVKGATDVHGLFSASGQTTAGSIGLSVWKDGYYNSVGQSIIPTNFDMLARRWEPWNPTVEVILQKKGIQVPMYARRVNEMKIPLEGQPVGFDLMVGDWVAPYGKGQASDFIIRVNSKPEPSAPAREYPPYDVTLTVNLSNDGDGIQSAAPLPYGFRVARQAPLEGYESVLIKHSYKEPGQPAHTDFRNDQNYFFRVRTKRDAQGNIVSALYGKINGEFNDGSGIGDKISFNFYLNSEPNSRNMEFDPKQNLSKNLKFMEGVNAP